MLSLLQLRDRHLWVLRHRSMTLLQICTVLLQDPCLMMLIQGTSACNAMDWSPEGRKVQVIHMRKQNPLEEVMAMKILILWEANVMSQSVNKAQNNTTRKYL